MVMLDGQGGGGQEEDASAGMMDSESVEIQSAEMADSECVEPGRTKWAGQRGLRSMGSEVQKWTEAS